MRYWVPLLSGFAGFPGFFRLFRCSTGPEWSCDVDGPGVSGSAVASQALAMLRMLMGSIAFTSLTDLRAQKVRVLAVTRARVFGNVFGCLEHVVGGEAKTVLTAVVGRVWRRMIEQPE